MLTGVNPRCIFKEPERFGFSLQEFQMISQTINSKSKLADYKNYHKQSKTYIQELESKLENKALNLSDYKRDYERRVGEHNKEVDFLIRDLTVLFTTAKRQVVQLFPVPVK